MDSEFKDKNVLVVGASKGIGKAIALSFASEGSVVTAIARTESLLKDLNEEMMSRNINDHKTYVVDLMEENLSMFGMKLLEERGPFDIVIHNVGGSLISRDVLGTLDEWEYAIKFNAGIAIALNNVLVPPMINKGYGRVVHISSMSAVSLRGNALYASAKAFLNAYVVTLGRALASKGVVVSAVMPGAVEFPGSYWDLTRNSNPEKYYGFLKEHQAINRYGTPQEIADAVLFLSSSKASFMQSSIIAVGGGTM